MGLFSLVKWKEEKKWIDLLKEMNVQISVQESSILKKIDMIHLTEQDMKLVKAIQPLYGCISECANYFTFHHFQ